MRIETIITTVYEVGDRFQVNKELSKLALRKGIYIVIGTEAHSSGKGQLLTIANSNAGAISQLDSAHLQSKWVNPRNFDRIRYSGLL